MKTIKQKKHCVLFYNFIVIVITFVLTFLLSSSCSNTRLNTKIAEQIEDKGLVIGKTENGVTFYLKNLQDYEDKVTIALIVNAGSVLEKDDQLGLAHFVEHMGFNGTTRFPGGNSIYNFFQKAGIPSHYYNATTSYDKTYFHISFPRKNVKLLTTGLDLLEDWLHNMSYQPQEIEKEKGVVKEEVRENLQPFNQAQHEGLNFFLEGTKYKGKSPYGRLDVIENAPREVIKSFYDYWYKPNLAAVAVIGNIDIHMVKKEILKRFRYQDSYVERPNFPLSPDTVGLFKSKFFPLTNFIGKSMGMISFRKERSTSGKQAFLNEAVDKLMYTAFNQRMFKVARDSQNLVSAVFDNVPLGRNGLLETIFFNPRKNSFFAAYQELVVEMEKLRRWGISQEEFTTLIDVWINKSENQRKNSLTFLQKVISHFTRGEIIVDDDKSLFLLKSIKAGNILTIEDINRNFKKLGKDTGARFIAIYPSEEIIPPQQKKEFANFYLNADKLNLKNKPKERGGIKEFLSQQEKDNLPEGKIISIDYDAQNQGYTLKLGNGVKVYFKPLATKENQIAVLGAGHNDKVMQYRGSVKNKLSFKYYPSAIRFSKIGGYGFRKVMDYLNSRSIFMSLSGDFAKQIDMGIPTTRLEEGLEFLHVLFSDVQLNPQGAQLFINDVDNRIAEIKGSDEFVLGKSYTDLGFPKFPLKLDWGDYDIKYFDPKLSYQAMKETIKNIADYTFYIVGNVETETLFPLIKKYLASIPPTASNPSDRVDFSTGITVKKNNTEVYQRGKGQSLVQYGWVSEFSRPIILKDQVLSLLITQILNMVMFEKIREEESGVYSIDSHFLLRTGPQFTFTGDLKVKFSTKPSRVSELIKKSKLIVTQLAKGKIHPQVMANSRPILQSIFNAEKNNLAEYASILMGLDFTLGINPLQGYKAYTEILKNISDKEVYAYLEEFLKNARYVEVIQNPHSNSK